MTDPIQRWLLRQPRKWIDIDATRSRLLAGKHFAYTIGWVRRNRNGDLWWIDSRLVSVEQVYGSCAEAKYAFEAILALEQ
jgi:hypothetical protein